VKMAAQPGSFSECCRPLSPRLSYAVAIGVPIEQHANDINCHEMLFQENMISKVRHRARESFGGGGGEVIHMQGVKFPGMDKVPGKDEPWQRCPMTN
jgi:hypothetical protein